MDRWRAAGALLALAACFACSAAAPTVGNHTALDLYEGAGEGCYYNFQHYGEGDRIMTNEPCLNCTCHNRMLMCYLRVCPFTKAIGQDCTVEKRADQCCPIVTCPDVPVDLLTSTSTTSPAEYGATGLGRFEKYGCSINGKYFAEGSKVPPTPNKPCEHCYCIRNMTTCVMQECTLHVDGCTPIYHKDVCCPVRYSCDHPEDEIPLLDDMTTTVRPTPGFLLTTTTVSPVTQMTQDCVHDDKVFADGALIKTEKACEHCYCMKGDIVCVVQECGTPMENEGKNCTSLPPREGQCCPDTYICEGDELSTEYPSEFTTPVIEEELATLSPPRRVGVEGSGYRNEPDEISQTELPFSATETEGSGYEQTIAHTEDTSEMSIHESQRPLSVEHKLTTTESTPIVTAKTPFETENETEESEKEKEDEFKEKPVIPSSITTSADYDKLTTESITEKISGQKVTSSQVIDERGPSSTEPTKHYTESEIESGDPHIELATEAPTELSVQDTPDKEGYEEHLLITTSSHVSEESEMITTEQSPETFITDGKTIETESHGSTLVTPYTPTLEEVEEEESDLDRQKISTERPIEEITTELHEYIPSPTGGVPAQKEQTQTGHVSGDEGLDKEITETHEFIPVTPGISTVEHDLATTEKDKEESVTDKIPEEEGYEDHITTSLPHIEKDVTATVSHKDETVTEQTNELHVSDGHELTSSTTSVYDMKESHISTPDMDIIDKKSTESHKDISSITDIPTLDGGSTESNIQPEIISDGKMLTTTPVSEEVQHIDSTEKEVIAHIVTAIPEPESSVSHVDILSTTSAVAYEPTAATKLEKEHYVTSVETTEEIKHKLSTEAPIFVVESEMITTEPDKGLNTIPARGDIVTSVPEYPISEPEESYITDTDEVSVTPESVHKENKFETQYAHITTTESYIEKELTSYDSGRFETTTSPKEEDTKYTTTLASDYGHEVKVTEHADKSTSELISETVVPTIELEKDTFTTVSSEKIPETSTLNQGDNEIEEDISAPGRIPGEGDCLFNGLTYRNQSDVPSTNNCHTSCKCISSIIKCDPIICSPPPDYMDNCQPTYDPPDACCPTYECTHSSKETMPPQPQSQMSGTQAPAKSPTFECRGDQCEISEDKVQPTVSHEVCKDGICKVEIDKIPQTSECGPQGCDANVGKIQGPHTSDSSHTDLCTDGNCVPIGESCTNGKCQLPAVHLKPEEPCEGDNCAGVSESLPDQAQQKCENEADCKNINVHVNPSQDGCEGSHCIGTEQKKPLPETEHQVICNEEGACKEAIDHVIQECKGESCRRKETSELEGKLPATCSGSECTQQTEISSEHPVQVQVLTDSEPSKEEPQKTVPEDTIKTITEQPEADLGHATEIATNVPEHGLTGVTDMIDQTIPETEQVVPITDIKLHITSESPVQRETASTESEIDSNTERQDIIQDQTTQKPVDVTELLNEYVTEKVEDVSRTTQKIDEERHEIKTKVPDLDIMRTTEPTARVTEIEEYITKLDTHVAEPQNNTISATDKYIIVTESQDIKIPAELEKVDTTESYNVVLEQKTELPEISTEKELIKEEQTPPSEENVTKHQLETSVVTESYVEPVVTEIEQQVSELETHTDLPLATSNPVLIDIVTPRQDEIAPQMEIEKETVTPSDKHKDVEQKTTASILIAKEVTTPSKPTDSEFQEITSKIPETYETESVESTTMSKHDVEKYEGATSKPELHITEQEEVAISSGEPHEEQKPETPTISGIDAEEYVTGEPEIGSELTTILAESYTTDFEASTTGPEPSEDVPKKTASELPGKITQTHQETEKETPTTKSSEIHKLVEENTSSSLQEEAQHKVTDMPEQLTTEKITNLPSLENTEKIVPEHEDAAVTVQEEPITQNILSLSTEKIYTKQSEKETDKLGKPAGEQIITENPVVTSPVPEYSETESLEPFIPVKEGHRETTTEKQEVDTDKIGVELESVTEVPEKEPSLTHEKETKDTESTATEKSFTDSSERATIAPEFIATEIPEKETKIPEAESHATVTKETQTEQSPPVELETHNPTVVPVDIEEEHLTTQKENILPVSQVTESAPKEPNEHQTTEFSKQASEETEESTKSPDVFEQTYVPEHQYSESTPELVELEEHTHKIFEETQTTPRFSPDVEMTEPQTTHKIKDVEDETTPHLSLVEEATQPETTQKILEEAATTPRSSSGAEVTLPESTQKVLQETTPRSSLEEEVSISETTDKILLVEAATTPHSSLEEEPTQPETTDMVLEEAVTTPRSGLEEEITQPKTTDKIFEEAATTPRSSLEEEASILETTKKALEEAGTTPRSGSEEEALQFGTTHKVVEDAATTPHSSSENEVSQPETTDKVLQEAATTPRSSSEKEAAKPETTDKVLEEAATTPRSSSEEEAAKPETTDKVLEEAATTPRSSIEEEASIPETTQKVLEEATTTPRSSSEEETAKPETTDTVLEEAATTPRSSLEEEASMPETTQKVLEEAATTPRSSSEKEAPQPETTDKVIEEAATTPHSSLEEEASMPETTQKVLEEAATTPRSSSEKEAPQPETTDKVLEEAATTPRYSSEEEAAKPETTDKVLEEAVTTPRSSSDEEAAKPETTDKVLEEAATTPHSSLEEEASMPETTQKVLEEDATTPRSSSEKEAPQPETTDKVLEEATTTPRSSLEEEASIPETTQKVLEEAATTTTRSSSEEEAAKPETTDKILEEATTTPRSSSEEEAAKPETTDKVLEEAATTPPSSSEEEAAKPETTDKVLQEDVTTPRSSLEKEASIPETTQKVLEEAATTPRSSSEEEAAKPETTDKVLEEAVTTPRSSLEEEATQPETTDKVIEEAATTPHSSLEEEASMPETTQKVLEEAATTPRSSSEKEAPQPETTDKVLEEAATTPRYSSEEEAAKPETTDKVLEEATTTPRSSSEEEAAKPETTDKVLEEAATTPPSSSEEEAAKPETTDKVLQEDVTTPRSSLEKEASIPETTQKVLEEAATTPRSSSEEEAAKPETTDKVLEEAVTTPRSSLEEEASQPETTQKILEEAATTPRSSSEEEAAKPETTDKVLEEAATTPRSSSEEEAAKPETTDKVLEEAATTPRSSLEEEASIPETTQKVLGEAATTPRSSSEEEAAKPETTDKVLQEAATTPRSSSEKEAAKPETTDKVLEEAATTPRSISEEEAAKPETTDKVLEEAATTPRSSLEEEASIPETTQKVLGEAATTPRSSSEEEAAKPETTDKVLQEAATTPRSSLEEEASIPETTNKILVEEAATTPRLSSEEEAPQPETTQKVLEETATTPRSGSEEEAQYEIQKTDQIPEVTTERIIDEQIAIKIERPTEVKEEMKPPVKESTEADLQTITVAPEVTTEHYVHTEHSSAHSPISQETDIKYTTETQDKEVAVTPTKQTEEETPHVHVEVPSQTEKTTFETEKPLQEILPQGTASPIEDLIPVTSKSTTISIEEYITTHSPTPLDKFTKPEEKPTEIAPSTTAPEVSKPSSSELQPTDEVPPPEEEAHFPPSGTSGYGGEPDYVDEDQPFGPGTCRYGGKVYVSAQQIPRDDPCDFCFCFRSDIICLQQSCPPPIHGCHEEPIQGFCCPRYECPVSMATTLNVTTTTTTTTTTLPPHFPTHPYRGAAQRRGCQIKGHTYKVGDVVRASSGPCLHCTCGGDGQMKCDPKVCTPEPMLRQMIAAAVSAKRRR